MKKPFHPGRPAGRLFYCLISVFVAVGVSRGAPPPPAPPATTTISDVIYRADGSTAAGTLLITWPAFTTADNRAVPAGSMSLAIGAFGAINLALVPNQGATPSGTYYKVVMKLNDGTTSEEFWVVPTLSPTTISAIRSQVVPQGVALQVVTRQYVDGQLATKADDAAAVHRTGNETVDGVKSFSASPTVPTPTTGTAAANRLYVDNATAGTQSASQSSGSDACVKIASSIAALPSTGGTVDARGLDGTQTCANTLTVSKPVTILLGAATLTLSGSPGINVTSESVKFVGLGYGLTVLKKGANGDMVTTSEPGLEFTKVGLHGNGASFTGRGIVLTGSTSTDFKFLDGAIEHTASAGIAFQDNGSGRRSMISRNILTTEGQANPFFTFPATDEFTALGFSSYRIISNNEMVGNKFGDLGGASITFVINNHFQSLVSQDITNGVMLLGNRIGSSGGNMTLLGHDWTIAGNLIADPMVINSGISPPNIFIGINSDSGIMDNTGKVSYWSIASGFLQLANASSARIQLLRNGTLEGRWQVSGGSSFFDFTGTLHFRKAADAAEQASLSAGGVLTANSFVGPLTGNASTASALAADPADCTGNNFARGINASGVAQCSQPSFSNLSGQAGAAQGQEVWALADLTDVSATTGAGSTVMLNQVPVLKSYSIAALPAAGTADRIAIVTDAVSAGNCNSGGGSSRSLCRDTGSAWEPLGDGGSGGGGANPALSNLASVAVNAGLVPGADGTLDLGSSSLGWRNLHAKGVLKFGPAVGSFGPQSQSLLNVSNDVAATLNAGATTVAFQGLAEDNSTNNAYGLYGTAVATHTSGNRTNVIGVSGNAYHTGAGTLSYLMGVSGEAYPKGGGDITAVSGASGYVEVNTTGGTITDAIQLWASGSAKTAGTVTNNYGLKVEDQVMSGANNYAIKTGVGLVSFGDTAKAPIFDAATGFRIAGAAGSGNVLRGNGTNFVSAALACADVTNCAALVASGTAGVGPSKAGTASTAARSDHDHRSVHTLTWFFPGTPSTGISPMILAVPQGIANGAITGMQVTVGTASASSSTFNLQRCTANCTGTSPTFANIYSSDNTLSANTSEADFGTTNLTTTLNAKDQFKANLVTIGSGLANVTLTLTYKYDTTN